MLTGLKEKWHLILTLNYSVLSVTIILPRNCCLGERGRASSHVFVTKTELRKERMVWYMSYITVKLFFKKIRETKISAMYKSNYKRVRNN